MLRNIATFGLIVIALAPPLGGCASQTPSTNRFSVRQEHGLQIEEAFRAAELAITDLGYALETIDKERGVLITSPVPATEESTATRRRISLTRPGLVREIAEVRLTLRDGVPAFYCRVILQELATEAHQMFARDRGMSDSPTETPIERGAAVTPEQEAVWQTVARDTDKERMILRTIHDHAERRREGTAVGTP